MNDKGMKRGFFLMFGLLMGMGSLLAQNYDFSAVNGDGKMIYYNITDSMSHEVEVAQYPDENSKYSGVIDIPSEVENVGIMYSVTGIGNKAFRKCEGLTLVVMPNSIVSIGKSSFVGCDALSSITIPNSVTTMGNSVFKDCSGLRSVTLSNSLDTICRGLFYGCSGLRSIVIPSSVRVIEDCVLWKEHGFSIYGGAFEGCSGLRSVEIPNSVMYLGDGTFKDCSGLESVTLPDGLDTIRGGVFYGCSGLRSIVIPNSVRVIEDAAPLWGGYNVVYGGAFEGCSGLSSIVEGDSVTEIGDCAFKGCRGLTSLVIGNLVEIIRGEAFSNCVGLESVTISGSVDTLFPYVFANDSNLRTVYWNARDVKIYGAMYVPNRFEHPFVGSPIEVVVFGDGVESIPSKAFENFATLDSVVMGSSILRIGNEAFNGCSGLRRMCVKATTPPVLGTNVFQHVRSTILVYVPCGSLGVYQNDLGWSYFTNIQCSDLEGIEDVEELASVRFYPNPTSGMIWVEGDDVEWVEVLNVMGEKVMGCEGEKWIDMSGLDCGVYVLRIGVLGDMVVRRVVKR